MKYAFNASAYSSLTVSLPAYPLNAATCRIAAIGYDDVEIGCAAPLAYPHGIQTNECSLTMQESECN